MRTSTHILVVLHTVIVVGCAVASWGHMGYAMSLILCCTRRTVD
jgi:hypothetical protein